MAKTDTPLLDELEKGKWPSFVKDMKQAAQKSPMAEDLLGQLELSYKEKIGHWKQCCFVLFPHVLCMVGFVSAFFHLLPPYCSV